MLEICSDLSKTGLKSYYFCQHSKKAKKWPNGQTILFLANSFKKGQMAILEYEEGWDDSIEHLSPTDGQKALLEDRAVSNLQLEHPRHLKKCSSTKMRYQ